MLVNALIIKPSNIELNGNSNIVKYKMEDNKPGRFYEKQKDEFGSDNKDNLTFKANLEYTIRYKN